MERRVIVVVLDGCGAGAAPDAARFGDLDEPSTLLHVYQTAPFSAPNLERLGFLAAAGIPGTPATGSYGRLRPMSMGKDSVTGHWEMMGIEIDEPFPTFPNGFPIRLVKDFEARIGTQTLGNRVGSGTQILDELGELHISTGFPIVYTSADSVFQVAAHEDVVPIEKLYEFCIIARELLVPPNHVQRVIARPFLGNPTEGYRRTERRKDWPVTPPQNLVDELGDVFGVGVVPELFGGRGFRSVRRTQNNAEHATMLVEALASDAKFIFANFEDFDMLYGHRSDPQGFSQCLAEFDVTLGELLTKLGKEDLLILTADHGNDPTDVSTDHTREYVPVALYHAGAESKALGDLDGLRHVGNWVRDWLAGRPI